LKTVFFYYNAVQKDTYWADEATVFFDDQGWWILEKGERNRITPDEFVGVGRGLGNADIAALIRELRLWGPVWARWCGYGDQQELILRSALFLILSIATGLRKLEVDVCVMHTGVSHHIDSVIFQTACRLAAVETVFLYWEALSSRLIPLTQLKEIEDRRALNKKITTLTCAAEIEAFIKNKEKDLPPKGNLELGGLATSWQWAVPYLFCKDCVQMIRLLRNKLVGRRRKVGIFDFASCTYPFQFTIQAVQQKYALQYLKKNTKPARCFRSQMTGGASPMLILAAHFQPEATSFPEGGDWGNHVDIALKVFQKGYIGTLLYKEHPATSLYLEGRNPTRVGMSRSRQYYEQLTQLGCEFIETEFQLSIDPQKNQWYLPITITGTIAIERALAGFHTIVTGYPWFKDMPGVLRLNDMESLSEIKPEWVSHDPNLAKGAFEFLETLLSGKTLVNVPGIGTGKPLTGQDDREAFALELAALLQAIKGQSGQKNALNRAT
jgi:hypothetical protein